MTRFRLPMVAGTLLGGALIAAACGGTASTPSPAASGAPAASVAGSAGSASAAVTSPSSAASAQAGGSPAVAVPTEPGAGSSFAVPSFAVPSFAVPSFATDNDLAAKFPTTIDGQPVSDVKTYLFIDILRFSGQTDAQLQQLAQSLSSFGITLSTLSSGTADATVDGESVQLSALRAPGADASAVITHFNEIQTVVSAAVGNPAPSEAPPTFSQANMGGKNITVATDSSGVKTYLYPAGDTLWSLQDVTDSQATKILAALQ